MRVSVHATDQGEKVGQAYDVAVQVERIEIWPLAEGGQGVMRLYGPNDKLLESIILNTMKRISASCTTIHPDIAALTPPPVEH